MLTWNELKKIVDQKLEEKQLDGDIKITYIGIDGRDTLDNTDVYIIEGTLQVL